VSAHKEVQCHPTYTATSMATWKIAILGKQTFPPKTKTDGAVDVTWGLHRLESRALEANVRHFSKHRVMKAL